MTFPEMKSELKDYNRLSDALLDIKDEIIRCNDMADAVREAGGKNALDGMPRKNALSDPTQKKAIEIIDNYDSRINELCERHNAIMVRRQRITDLLLELDKEEYAVISARYVDGIHWDYIPSTVHMSRMKCFRVHDRAINKMLILYDTFFVVA